ncbi:MAG: hypothetical protein FWF31_12490 [Desulfobulbus sp.]|nr:hypothetical protein [Desulfobulbus sp.]
MRERLKPMLFDDEHLDEGRQQPALISAQGAVRSAQAKRKDCSRLTDDQIPLHSFNTLLKDLATFS